VRVLLDVRYGPVGPRGGGKELLQVRKRLGILPIFALSCDKQQPTEICDRPSLKVSFRDH